MPMDPASTANGKINLTVLLYVEAEPEHSICIKKYSYHSYLKSTCRGNFTPMDPMSDFYTLIMGLLVHS